MKGLSSYENLYDFQGRYVFIPSWWHHKHLPSGKASQKMNIFPNFISLYNLALITKLPSSTLFPPTKLNIALNVAKAIENTGRKWCLLSDMEFE